MAKGKSKNGNPAVNSKKENIERFKERAKAAKVKSAEDQWKDMLAAMSEEEAKAFLAQLDVAAKEADLAEREQAIKDIQAGFGDIETELDNRDTQQGKLQEVLDGRESAVQERETAVGARETKADKKDSELMGRERSIIEREANAENEFAIQNRKALDALRKRKEELDAEILALEQKKIEKEDTLEQQIEGLRKAKLEALDAEIADLSEKRRVAAKAEANQIVADAKAVAATERANIQNEMTVLKTLSTQLNAQKLEQEKKEKQLADREQTLEFGEDDLRSEQGDIPNQIKAGVEKAAGTIQTKLTQAEKDREHYRRRLKECEAELEGYRQQELEADGMTMAELLEKLA